MRLGKTKGTSTRRALLVVDVLLVFDCVEAGM